MAAAQPLATRLGRYLLAWTARPVKATTDPRSLSPHRRLRFRCNLCGAHDAALLSALSREIASCAKCGSTVRFRAIAHIVVRELLRSDLALSDAPMRRDLRGLGLTDAHPYATPLAEHFDYQNTFYHTEPKLDIMDVPRERFGQYDFIIASDVFEHVAPPVSRAFANARRLLKPGGIFVFTVPFSLDPMTVEHFPELHEWRLEQSNGRFTLYNRTRDGRDQVFDQLVFHGGDGSTLEMRLFSRAGLEREFADAGFSRIRIADEPYLPFGIYWPEPWSVPIVAYT